MLIKTERAQRPVVEVKDAAAFIDAMNERQDVGRVEVVIQVKHERIPGERTAPDWIDLVQWWQGEWDRTRPPQIPSRREYIGLARESGARWARIIVRSVV